MKNIFKKIAFIIITLLTLSAKAQMGADSTIYPVTPNAMMDTLYDRFGNQYTLYGLELQRHVNGGSGLYAAVTTTCSAGYFNLYFETGSLGIAPSYTAANQAVICQVFSDISAFIISPLTTTGHHVNVWVRNFSTFGAPPGVLGLASQFYTAPSTSATSGIVDGEVQKTIISGIDSYTGVSPFLNPIGGGLSSATGVYFHSVIAFDFSGTYSWNNSLTSPPSSSQYDLYTTVLHEATHTLGFASLINNNGYSKLAPYGINYYSRYDTYLQDHNNNNLIVQSSTVCPSYQYGFNSPTVSTLELTPATTCTNDINFVGVSSSVNQKCYTPSTWAGGSSISHMDDPCQTPTGYPTGTYYLMSYATGTGIIKRYHKPEERNVLCNLGYNINTTFGSSTNLNYYNYGGSACPGIGIAGVNDGISTSTGNYIYTTTSGTLTIPITGTNGVLSNDYMASTLTCVQNVYPSSGSVTNVSSTNITFTVATNYFGAVLLRYIPENSSGTPGNITYITAIILPSNCSPVSSCNIVQNNGFESMIPSSVGYCAGDGYWNKDIGANCWYTYLNTPDFYTRGCNNSGDTHSQKYNLGTNTMLSSPTFDSHTGAGAMPANDHVLGFFEGNPNLPTPAVGYPIGYTEANENFLGTPLVPNTAYQLSFWAYNYQGSLSYPNAQGNPASTYLWPNVNSYATPQIVTFAAAPSFLASSSANNFSPYYPVTTGSYTMDVLPSFTITPINSWNLYTTTFTYTGAANDNFLFVGANYNANVTAGYTNSYPNVGHTGKSDFHYLLIDDISMLPVSTAPTFSLPTTTFTCGVAAVNNLQNYVTPPGGTFSGPGVTSSAGSYTFNPALVPNGTLTIVYSYTNSGCANSISEQVVVNRVPMTVTTTSTGLCAGSSATLTASGASSYTWSPGGATTASVVVTPTTTTVYSVSGTSGTCVGTNTVGITVSSTPTVTAIASSYTACGTLSNTLTASGATNYTWSPTTYVSGTNTVTVITAPYNNPTIAYPPTSTIFTVTGTNPGCATASTATVSVNVTNPFVSLTPTQYFCTSQGTLTLTATSTNTATTTYTWSPGATLSCTNCASPVATPTATTTYSVTGNTSGCIVTNTVLVWYYVSPTLTVVASPTLICAGQTSTLSVSGAGSYNWSPAGSLNTTGSATVIASPTVTTIYTVIGYSTACSNTKTVTVTVNPAPSLTVTASPTAICAGQTSTLTASGGSTYTWSPSGSLSSTTGSTVTATPTITTNYSVSSTGTNSCVGIKTMTLTINPTPTISISGTPSVCAGSSTTLTASGATNYTWTPSTALTCTSCASPVANPTVTTTYTVTGTYTTGCSSYDDQIVNVYPSSCTGTAPSSYTLTTSTNYTVTPTLISNNLYVGTTTATAITYTLNNIEAIIGAGYTITVVAGNTLTINNSWLHACRTCTSASMWQGIVVQNGASLYITNSIIEDATQAVYVSPCSSCTNTPYYSISGSILNNNGTGVYIDATTNSMSSCSILGTLFTCRDLSNHTANSTNIGNIITNVSNATPLITSLLNPTDLTIAGTRTKYGMYLNQVAVANAVNIGAPKNPTNYFDNMDYGIYNYESSLTAKNNIFQNLTGNSAYSLPIGVGIYNDASTNTRCSPHPCTVRSVVQVGNSGTSPNNQETNYFKNCLIGVSNNYLRQVYINNNNFSMETTATTFTTSGSYVTGQYGVYNLAFAQKATTSDAEEMIFANNTIQNYAIGSFIDFSVLTNTVVQTYSVGGGSACIYNNTISGVGSANQYCNTGLYLQQSSLPGANSGVPQGAVSAYFNNITNATSNAVNVTSLSTPTVGFVTISQNTLTIQYNSAATTLQSPPLAAVNINNSYAVKVSNNPVVGCQGLSSYPYYNAQFTEGIYVNGSPGCKVNCNNVSGVGEGFVWSNNCASSKWLENTVTNAQYGLVLRSSGIMGIQGQLIGFPAHYAGDQWGNTNISIAQTLSDGSNPGLSGSQSIIYNYTLTPTCTGATCYLPCVNNLYGIATAYTATGGTPTLVQGGTASYGYCTSEGGTGGRLSALDTLSQANNNSDPNAIPSDSLLQDMLSTPDGSFPVYDYETHWSKQYYVSGVKPSIAARANYTNAKYFALVDIAIKNGDYTTANSILGSISPANIIERNWNSVDNIVLNMVTQNRGLNAGEANTLQSIATQCPLTGGGIVLRARAMLNTFYGTVYTYPNDCPINYGGSAAAKLQNSATSGNIVLPNQSIKLYPNPNNGTMTIEYNLINDGYLEITDINGRLVDKYILPATAKMLTINNETLENGMYFYHVTDNADFNRAGKIVIMK